jgi:hypothetical protein
LTSKINKVESAHKGLKNNNEYGREEGEKQCKYKALVGLRFDMVRNEIMSV